MIHFAQVDTDTLAVYHTIYTAANIFDRFDWNERVDDAIACTEDKTAYFLYENTQIIGGFTLKENRVNYPFIVAPYHDRERYWGMVLDFATKESGKSELFLNEISEADMIVLTQSYNATLRWSKQRMIRPTEKCTPILDDDFYFDILAKADRNEIIDVIFAAHADGYTSAVWETPLAEIESAVDRRFDLFERTDTLFMSNTVKHKVSNQIAGVCIAGIYPEEKDYSTSSFATIHQISVRPEYQRKGIAKAMLNKSIHDAAKRSPAITLGVLVGNPAEKLYAQMGFRPGPRYSELLYRKE